MTNEILAQNHIVVFNDQQIRRTFHNDEWWFVVQDVVKALTDSVNPALYTKAMRRRDPELNKGWIQIVSTLSVETPGGRQKLNCANTEGIFRIIQSIPSPKAEPFKRWLAKVGYERVKEIEDPELASQRARALYQAKGYPDSWIEKRMRGIQIRDELTNEWKRCPSTFYIFTALADLYETSGALDHVLTASCTAVCNSGLKPSLASICCSM